MSAEFPRRLVGTEGRLYGMMQFLLMEFVRGVEPMGAAVRGVVEEQDAVDAVAALAMTLDEQVQTGRIDSNAGAHMGALLMTIRDYVRPLPVGVNADGSDGVPDDLREMVDALRTTFGRDEN